MTTIKRIVKVTIEKEFEIEIMPSMFGGLTEEAYLEEFRKGLWYVESMDDVIKFAARMAAYNGSGEHDGIGLIGPDYSTYPRVPDVKYRELSDECEEEFID